MSEPSDARRKDQPRKTQKKMDQRRARLEQRRGTLSWTARIMQELAAQRGVEGPYNIGRHVRERLGLESRPPSTYSEVFSGAYRKPAPVTLRRFAEAFELTDAERFRLAYAIAFDEEPPEQR